MKTSKRIISFLLTIVMTLSIVPMAAVQSGAATVTLQQLQSKYPHGKYWNGGNANSYTSNPCTHHGNCSYSGSCGCNSFKGHAIQCMGFAYQLAYLVYGGDPYVDWKSNKNVSALDSLKAGDVVRYKNNGHSIFVTGVSGNTVTYADCNSDGHCKIRWNQTIQKSELRASFSYVDPAPYAWNPSSGPHTHSYSGRYFEAAHPHKVYKKCSCGATQYTGETVAYASCSTCMHLSWSYVMPVKAYTINTGKTTVYNAVNGTAKTNKIYDTDLCTISEIYDCGWCKVTFPLNAGGTETGYCKINVFMKSGGYIMYASKQITTYRRSDLKTTVGKTAIGDKIYVLGTSGSSVQIAYPLDTKTWQVGWVPTSAIKCTISYNANGGSGTMASTSVQYNSSFTLAANSFTKTGYTFSGWNVYRSSDKTWYVSGQGWKTASEISNNKYSKNLYKNQYNATLSKSWINLGKTNDTLTFYAVWTPNKLTVNYNANGGTLNSNTYKLNNGIVYKTASNEKLNHVWTYNVAQKDGLYNASTFGLTREGYIFKGWGTTASGGTVFDQNDGTLLPTDIHSAIKNGNCTTTLYAIWEKIPATVSSISIQSKPSKTVYTIGEKFDASGLSVKVTMSDGTTKTITSGFTLSNPDMTVAGTKTVTVTYSGKTTSFTITVNNPPAVVSSIAIQSKPTKTVYTVGEKFDASGLSVKVTMSDGTTKTITSGFTLSNPDMTVAGTKTVTVTYSGKTASFTITVKAAEPSVNAGALRLITPASARIGQTVQIPVQLDKASLGTLTFTVTYDRTKLKYVSCTESAFDMCDAYAGNAGVVKLACIDNTAVSAGRIAVLTFEVIAPAACLTDLTVAIEEAYDGSDKAVSLAGGTWNLSVVKTLLGDVNGDGKITAIDARWALQAASGARMLTEEQKAAADANGDGKITAIDARWILQAASGSRVL